MMETFKALYSNGKRKSEVYKKRQSDVYESQEGKERMVDMEELIIIGSGPAGLSAAIYAARNDLKPLVLGGSAPGGQLLLTTTVDNYPGFPEGIYGSELIDNMRKQAERFGARFENDDVIDIDVASRPFKIKTAQNEYEARALIIATGATTKWLGLESEKRLIGRGVSSCATCDAAFFRDKDVVVVGGGDTAMEDSVYLTKFAKSVTIVHRRDEFRATKIMQERALSNPKIKVIYNTVIDEILGNERVTGVKLKNVKTNELTELPVQGVFVAIGNMPNSGFLKGKLELDEQGYIITNEEVKTAIDGLFVAGDVADKRYQQAITAAASGAKAAIEAGRFLQNEKRS